jgi:hypothetical protein
MTRQSIDRFIAQISRLKPAVAGTSDLQEEYRRALVAGGVLVALVLLIACANIANLMTSQAGARAREMALRVSIGAGRWRLVQLVMVESAILAMLAAALGAGFGWWAAPFVEGRISSASNPVRLSLPGDWRALGFGLVLTLVVTVLFGLGPALLGGEAGGYTQGRAGSALAAADACADCGADGLLFSGAVRGGAVRGELREVVQPADGVFGGPAAGAHADFSAAAGAGGLG